MYYTDLFYTFPGKNGKWRNPVLLSRELTGILNEGPSAFGNSDSVIYYIGNMNPPQDKTRGIKVYKLGVFVSGIDARGRATEPRPFELNAPRNNYNTAHPSLSPGGDMMFFSSDRGGGEGKSDLCLSIKASDSWSEPLNLGKAINTKGNDLFPHFTRDSILYFASDGRPGFGGIDIWMSRLKQEQWTHSALPESPINSEFDDFSFFIDEEGISGFLASNRDGTDDIYSFSFPFPAFDSCRKMRKTSYCFSIQEEELINTDSLPLRYEWDFGDGNSATGLAVKHCFANTGTYLVKLNVVDTTTNQVFMNVSEVEISVQKPYQTWTDLENAGLNQQALFTASNEYLENTQVADYYWIMSDGTREKGEQFTYQFDTPGEYRLILGAISDPDSSGKRKRVCAYRDFSIGETVEDVADASGDPGLFRKKVLWSLPEIRQIKGNKLTVIPESMDGDIEIPDASRIAFSSPAYNGEWFTGNKS